MSKIFVVETPYWLRHRSILRLYLWRVISACFFLCRSSLLDFWCMLNYINNNHKNIKKKIEKKWSTISTIINNNHKNIKKIQKYIYIYIYIYFSSISTYLEKVHIHPQTITQLTMSVSNCQQVVNISLPMMKIALIQ